MSPAFSVTDRRIDEHTYLLTVRGEVDLGTVPALKEKLLIGESQARRLLVDLSDVQFLDSTGLGLLIGAHGRMARKNGSLAVICDSDNETICRVFDVTGLDGLLSLTASLDDALGLAVAA
jgi:anti-sigma B factor antagonist